MGAAALACHQAATGLAAKDTMGAFGYFEAYRMKIARQGCLSPLRECLLVACARKLLGGATLGAAVLPCRQAATATRRPQA